MASKIINVEMNGGGQAQAWLATPDGPGPWPGVVILPEIYNANHWVREVADGYAAAGLLALAPDIYWRQDPGQYLAYTPEGQAVGRALGFSMDLQAFSDDMRSYVAALAGNAACTGRIGSVGFCLGGKLVYLAAARGLVDAGVAYYAVQVDQHLDEAATLKRPLLMHFGELDAHVPPESYAVLRDTLIGKPDVELHMYPSADHGFNRFGYPPYHEKSATLALQRSLDFLRQHLV